LNEIDSQLAEIDENLIRNELSMLERSEQLERRKRLYEAKFPQTKKGGDRKSDEAKNLSAESALRSFAQDTAAKTNQSKRTVAVDVQIAKSLSKQVRDAICIEAHSPPDERFSPCPHRLPLLSTQGESERPRTKIIE
jgi:ParB family chromosome partitioning protein